MHVVIMIGINIVKIIISRRTDLGLIYARTCRVRNGYSTERVDVSYKLRVI
jgi:hypothetical protein